MNEADALAALLGRVAAAGGAGALVSERELADWPAAAVARLKTEGLLAKGPPADVVTCPGCEEDCAMPVEVSTGTSGNLHAFVVCDRRDDVARVAVYGDSLEQWTCSPARVADALARLLGTRRTDGATADGRWEVGVLKGARHSAHVVLGIADGLRLAVAGHSLAIADVLELGNQGLVLDRRALLLCVDNPVAAAGDQESAEQRRERLRKRRDELKAQGEHHYNKALAEEEGITVGRIKQLLKEEKPASTESWFDLSPKASSQKRPKTKS